MNQFRGNETPAGSNVYRNPIVEGEFDPGRGRTFVPLRFFYKHTIPPGLISKPPDVMPTPAGSNVYRKSIVEGEFDPGRGRTFVPLRFTINIQSLRD